MPDDTPLKSAYELAMERLLAKDREAGIAEPKRLTAKQKKQIAELRRKARARLAELQILHRDQIVGEADPAKIDEAEENYRRDRDRVERTLESDIARVKSGSA